MVVRGGSSDASSAALGAEELDPPASVEAAVFPGSVFTICVAVTHETGSGGGGASMPLMAGAPCVGKGRELDHGADFPAAAEMSGGEDESLGAGWSIADPADCKPDLPSDDCRGDEDCLSA
jgi:hypothetical protein